MQLAGAEVGERDIAGLELLPRLPPQEVRIGHHLHSFALTNSLEPFQVSGPQSGGHGSSFLKLEAPVALMLMFVEKDDGLGRGIVDADLLRCLRTPSLTSKMLWPCPKTRLRNSNFICLLILR
jgi:hypothetical protein